MIGAMIQQRASYLSISISLYAASAEESTTCSAISRRLPTLCNAVVDAMERLLGPEIRPVVLELHRSTHDPAAVRQRHTDVERDVADRTVLIEQARELVVCWWNEVGAPHVQAAARPRPLYTNGSAANREPMAVLKCDAGVVAVLAVVSRVQGAMGNKTYSELDDGPWSDDMVTELPWLDCAPDCDEDVSEGAEVTVELAVEFCVCVLIWETVTGSMPTLTSRHEQDKALTFPQIVPRLPGKCSAPRSAAVGFGGVG